MKVTNEKTENSQAFLTIEMEPAEVEESMEKSYRRLVQKTKIPGFRKGKAPRVILERHIGKDSLFDEALNNMIPQAYEKAIEEQEIEAFAQPQIEITQNDPVIFKAIVPLKPTIKLGDYRQIRLTPEAVEINEDNVAAVIEQLRHQHATWEPVERPVDFGDLVVLNIESTTGDKPFVNREGLQFQVLRDTSFPMPGFAEQLAGMKKDEEKKFQLSFPADYPRAELAEKETQFKVKVTEIKQEILPEVNDDFAREVDTEFKTMEVLRERASSDLKRRAEDKSRIEFEDKVVNAVVDLAEVEFPPILVESEINRIIQQRFRKGRQELEEYLKSIKKTDEELWEELRPVASKRVATSLVIGKVCEEEKLEVSADEINAEIENIKSSATENNDEIEKLLDTPQTRESIEHTLLTRKTIQSLVEMAQDTKENKTTAKNRTATKNKTAAKEEKK